MSLYPHQKTGAQFLMDNPRAYLGDQMSLGKTIQTLVAARRLGLNRVFVTAPASAIENWYRERDCWAPGLFLAVKSWGTRDDNIVGSDWDLVVLDEAHRAKTAKAQRTKRWLPVAAAAPRAWLLSGTPMPRHPGELWTVFNALWPELLRPEFNTEWKWFRYFCRYTMTQYGPRVYGVKNGKVLRGLVNQMMLRRKLEDEEVKMGLPPLRVTAHTLPRDAGFNEALVRAGVDAVALQRQMDGAEDYSRTRRLLGEYKAPRIADIIVEELEERQYQKIVVMYYHKAVGAMLRKKFAPFGCVGFDGAMPAGKRRQQEIDTFTNDLTARVFCAQQGAAGEAINLQAASEIVLVEPEGSPDPNRQVIKRIHRPGQGLPCRARIFCVAGSVDEPTMRTMARRAGDQKEIGL